MICRDLLNLTLSWNEAKSHAKEFVSIYSGKSIPNDEFTHYLDLDNALENDDFEMLEEILDNLEES